MKLSRFLHLSALVAQFCVACGCHTPNGRTVFRDVPDAGNNTSPRKLAPSGPAMATVVVCYARPNANREDIVEAISANFWSGVWWRERKLKSDLHTSQRCADSIMSGTKVTFYLEADNAKSLFWALTTAGAYAQLIQ
jgi:hypothetical protein